MSVSGWAVHEALDKAERACAVRKAVGVSELYADIDACEFCTIDSVREVTEF
jgi:hypothetical protein